MILMMIILLLFGRRHFDAVYYLNLADEAVFLVPIGISIFRDTPVATYFIYIRYSSLDVSRTAIQNISAPFYNHQNDFGQNAIVQ
uniref:Uncharacterized protein n=1 Tax=Romanomermis culicivorax TaxID=13658 RepID=A0A915HRA1_ROMCU